MGVTSAVDLVMKLLAELKIRETVALNGLDVTTRYPFCDVFLANRNRFLCCCHHYLQDALRDWNSCDFIRVD